jgi:hypothetical protein
MMEINMEICQKKPLKIELPYDPIPLLGIYPEETKSCTRDTCMPRLIATYFTVVKIWKKAQCLTMDQ